MNYGSGIPRLTMESLLPCSNQLIKKAKKNLGKLLWLYFVDNSIYALVKGSGEAIHSINIDQYGNAICSCQNETYRSSLVCKHILIVLYQLGEKKAIEVIDKMFYKDKEKEVIEMDANYVKTNLEGINKLIGGLPIGSGLMIIGWHAVGKTIILTQFAFEVMMHYLSQKQIANALILDTEGNRHSYELWAEELKTRYGLDTQLVEILVDFKIIRAATKDKKEEKDIVIIGSDPAKYDQKKNTLFFMDVRGIDKIVALFGRQCEMRVSEGGKIDLYPTPNWQFNALNSVIGDFILKNNVRYLGIDSVSTPLLEFGTTQQNYPARFTATNFWLLPAEQLAKSCNLVLVGNVHVTKRPDNPYDVPDHFGGKGIGHVFKFGLELKRKKDNIRELRLERAPKAPDKGKSCDLILTDVGFLDHVEKGK